MNDLGDQDIFLQTSKKFSAIAKKISITLSKKLATRAFIAIVDLLGIFHHVDIPAYDEFLYFIPNFVNKNFNLLDVGDYSIPLGGISLAFFKISSKAIIVLYTPKGPSGQLLYFKSIMYNWVNEIDDLLGEINKKTADLQIEKSKFKEKFQMKITKKVPLLVKTWSRKDKFSIEVASVLQYCNGIHSLNEISKLTNIPLLKVNMIIQQYKKKKWIKIFKYVRDFHSFE
ncbi:MAG: hypothetical protein ACFFD2_13140 [Promethearchaeota archaeon]